MFAILAGGALTTILIALNYTRDLVGLFTFIILLSTLSTLIPYVFSSLAVFVLPERVDGRALALPKGGAIVAAVAFVYSLWPIAGVRCRDGVLGLHPADCRAARVRGDGAARSGDAGAAAERRVASAPFRVSSAVPGLAASWSAASATG